MRTDPLTSMELQQAYDELGLRPGASSAEVKAAWRRAVSRWHPDRNPNGEAVVRMQRINRAFERVQQALALQDPPSAPSRPEPAPPAAEPARPAPHAVPTRVGQAALRRRVRLSLEEAAAGCVKTLSGRADEHCGPCAGLGYLEPGGPCPRCDGSGSVHVAAWFGWARLSSPCPDCGGTGRLRKPCAACEGVGRFPRRRYRLTVRLPAGVRSGDTLHVPGQPDHPLHPAADLTLEVRLAPHPLFTLATDGTLHCELPVDGFAWMANHWVEVPTLAGLQQMRLDRRHHHYRLRGQGFPATRRGPPADLMVRVHPQFPTALSAAQQAALEALLAATAAAPPPELADWQQRLHRWQASHPEAAPAAPAAPPEGTTRASRRSNGSRKR